MSYVNIQDTLFDYLVFDASDFLHHNVYKTGNEAGQKADQTTDDPATDLQTAESLQIHEEERSEKESRQKEI